MRYDPTDRVPYFEEDIREEVLEVWRSQGLPPGADISRMFSLDTYEQIDPDLDPLPEPAVWPTSLDELDSIRLRLDPDDPNRLADDWTTRVRLWRARHHVLVLRVHNGLFLSMGRDGWQRFREVIYLLADDPGFASEVMRVKGEFAAKLAEKVLAEVEVDAAEFVEPISDNNGPLISPRMYEDLALRSYEPLLAVLGRCGVKTIIYRTFANTRLLLPVVLKHGFNCLWAGEVNTEKMGYRDLRKEFGRELRLIGGIDLDALRCSKEAIRREIMEKVPPLLEEGGYIPMADGRMRVDVPFENYVYYRELLKEVTVRPASAK